MCESTPNKLRDPLKRQLNYLRISITDRCNLNCSYCRPVGIQKLSHFEILRYEEILRIVRVGITLGIKKVRVTGGEPLVRKGVYDFLDQLARLQGLCDISLTTNGVHLKDHILRIQQAGIKRINISLDTLNALKYEKITGSPMFAKVWDGIMAAHEQGFAPIKLNVVALRRINDDEFLDFAKLTLKYPFHVRFIEYMPMGQRTVSLIDQILAPEIEQKIQTLGPLIPIESDQYAGPAKRFKVKDALGEIGFIQAISQHFCKSCNRLRLTANGQLRACLLSNSFQDVKHLLRSNGSDKDLADLFIKTVNQKPDEHHLAPDCHTIFPDQMSTIGG